MFWEKIRKYKLAQSLAGDGQSWSIESIEVEPRRALAAVDSGLSSKCQVSTGCD